MTTEGTVCLRTTALQSRLERKVAKKRKRRIRTHYEEVMLLMDESPQLPPEVWVCVFTYLATEEKHAVRTCCKYFKKLIDHPSLWKEFTVVLREWRRYSSGFWNTLRARRAAVSVEHVKKKDWKRLNKYLSNMASVVFTDGGDRVYKEKYFDNMLNFPNLDRLGVRNTAWSDSMLGSDLTGHFQLRLTRLSVCNVRLDSPTKFMNAVSNLCNLKYLLYHQEAGITDARKALPMPVFHHMLNSLQKLTHLSWGLKGEVSRPLHDNYFFPVRTPHRPVPKYCGPALVSLELVDYPENLLSENALRSLTSLRSLTVRYKYMREGVECRLRFWLSYLNQLTALTIIGGNSLCAYTTTIPATVTSLTLRVAITLKDMDTIAPKVPGLLHLDIEQNRSSGSLCRRIPMLFPHLRTLRIRFFRREPEKDLLSLHRLRSLRRLELLVERSYILRDYLNGHPWPSPNVQELISELCALSNHRINVVTTMRQRNAFWECDCKWEGD